MRALACRVAEAELAARGHALRCGPVDAAALAHWRHLWRPAFRTGAPGAHWRWDALRGRLRRDPYRFEVAIWGVEASGAPARARRGDVLSGLAVGVLSNRRRAVRVQYLARSPVTGAPLKGVVALTAATVAEAYARTWNAVDVRFEDPLPGAEAVYRALGYVLVEPPAGKRYFVVPPEEAL